MALITDLDLLRIEPSVFTDAADIATILLSVTDGSVSGTTLTSASADFETLDVDAGHVIVVDGEAMEIAERLATTQLTITRPRADADDPLVETVAGSSLTVTVPTFGRQIDLAEAWIFGALGINSLDPLQPMDSTMIINTDDVGQLVAVQAVAHIFTVAAATDDTDSTLEERAVAYANVLSKLRHQTCAFLDTTGDGVADITRQIAVPILRRL